MKWIGWAAGLVVLTLAGVDYYGSRATRKTDDGLADADSEVARSGRSNVDSNDRAVTFAGLGRSTIISKGQAAASAGEEETPGFWWLAEVEDASALPSIRDDVRNARLAGFDRNQISALQKGDVMSIPIPQTNQSYLVNVTAVKTTKNGNKVIRGRVEGTPNGSLFTLGKSSLFATVGTPDGIFNISGNASLAWIVEAKELNHHVDPNFKDYVSAVVTDSNDER